MIEAKKQKRPSVSSLFEAARMRRPADANAKPGKSTHPYDTGVGENTGKEATQESVVKSSAIRTRPKRSTEQPRETALRTHDKLLDVPTGRLAPGSSQDGTPSTAPPEEKELTCSPAPPTESNILGRHMIGFRSMLGAYKNQKTLSNTTPSIATSASPNQPSAATGGHKSWWYFNKQRSASDTYGITKPLIPNEEHDLILKKLQRTRKPVQNPRYGAKKPHKNEKFQESIEGQQPAREQWEEAERLSPRQPTCNVNHEASKALGPKQQKWYRWSPSSSQARPSTDRTRATPATQKDFVREDSRTETPPITTAQALRSLIGSGRSPTSKAATPMDLTSPRPATSTSALLVRQPSRESHISTDHRNRNWIPFWPSPRPPSEGSHCRDVDGRLSIEPEQGKELANRKGCLGRVSRKGWRSG
ncbi:hypothetical protein GGR53DRAFT_103727 [Hypoxylon sp. FL1150]|nr:hypothetical protein GGR53DRAFT_103727 [Hypoxylon sp. FL1150]